MKKAKAVGLTSILVLVVITTLTITVIKTNATANTGIAMIKTPASASGAPVPTLASTQAAISMVMPVHTATPAPKGAPTQATRSTHTTTSTQPPAMPSSGSNSDRYYPIGTTVAAIKAMAANLTKQQVKAIIEKQIDANWSVIQSSLGFGSKGQAYAFFLGMATRESTLSAALETGSGASHSYGPLQASETAYADANPSYSPENDVPQMVQYAFTPQNFYDPGIAVHMGIRHLIHSPTSRWPLASPEPTSSDMRSSGTTRAG